MIKQYCIKIMRGEKKSRLPMWFWGNLLCVNFVKHGIWFWRKGDELMYVYPWVKPHGGKFISMLFSGNGDFGDAVFNSLKELDRSWDDWQDLSAKVKDSELIPF